MVLLRHIVIVATLLAGSGISTAASQFATFSIGDSNDENYRHTPLRKRMFTIARACIQY
jgi:hypothetical protein